MNICQPEKKIKIESLTYSLGNSLCNAEQALTQIISLIFDDDDNLKISDEQFSLEFMTSDISFIRNKAMDNLQKISLKEQQKERSR